MGYRRAQERRAHTQATTGSFAASQPTHFVFTRYSIPGGSAAVRANNARVGPGKHLLHAQYLHRESIAIVDVVIERALAMPVAPGRGQSLLLEKTLFDLAPVRNIARGLRERGCHVHLLGTHIDPLRNWAFLSNRMESGQAFGRYITKRQTLAGLRKYHANMACIIEERMPDAFDSIHVHDVMSSSWCVSMRNERPAVVKNQLGTADKSRLVKNAGGQPPDGFNWGSTF